MRSEISSPVKKKKKKKLRGEKKDERGEKESAQRGSRNLKLEGKKTP